MRGKLLLIILTLIFSSTTKSIAYDTDNVHPLINDNALLQSNVNNYFKTQLGFVNGIKEVFKNKRITEWIKEGAKLEDETVCRSRNHFHDPLKPWDSAGLNNIAVNTFCFSIGEDFSVDSSIIWAQKSPGSSVTKNYWSWPKARSYYYKALTSSTKDEREQNFAFTFRALGQVMHLLSDSSVPAHVRNDIHVFPLTIPGIGMEVGKQTYESWARKKFSALDYTAKKVDLSIFNQAVTNSSAPVPISALWDQNKYTGTNPSVTWTTNPSISAFGLAEYTNANFFSEDTIFNDYPHPKKENTTARLVEQTAKDGKKDKVWYIQGYTSERLAAYSYLNKWLLPDKWEYNLDGYVYEDYASQLIPRAVGYSAGLLNYFFRGDIDMVPDDTTGSGYVIVNNTDEDMSGIFELWYDNDSDQRIRIDGWSLSIGKKNSGNNKGMNITFTEPTNAKEDRKYMLVFRGKLGNEEDAFAGRIVELKGGEYLFLVSAYDHSVAAFKIKTTNNQYQLIPVSKNIAITFADAPSTLLTVQSHPNKKEHVVALPSYRYDYSGNLVTTYEPNIAKYGKKIPYSDYLGYTHYVTVGFPQAYIPTNFNDDKSPYMWDSGLTYGEWTYTKVGNYYTSRLASYIHGRRPFSVVGNKLVAKNISIRKNNDYTYSSDDYSGPFHIQYKDASGGWIRGVDLPFKGGARTYLSEGIGMTYDESRDSSSPSNGEWIQHVVVTGQIVKGPIISEEKETPVDYSALINKDGTIHTTTDLSESITMAAGGALATINANSEGTRIWWRPSVPGWYDEHCNNFIEKEKSERQMNYLEFRDHSGIASSVKLYIGDNIIHAFESRAEQAWGEWNLYGSDWIKIQQWDPSDCCLYEHSMISTESSHDAGISGPTFTIPVPGGTYTGFSSDSEHSYKGETLGRVMDYDYIDSGEYIMFYEYYEHNSVGHGKQLSLGMGLIESASEKSVGAFGFGFWSGGYQDYSYYDLTTKYRLVYKTENIAIIDIDVSNHSTDERYSDVYRIDENYVPIEERWQKTETSGSRITGISCQISGNSMVYTYRVEQSRELTDEVIWEFSKRVIGIINISDNALPIGYRQEFEITKDNAGNINPNFDFKYLAAIGVHAD